MDNRPRASAIGIGAAVNHSPVKLIPGRGKPTGYKPNNEMSRLNTSNIGLPETNSISLHSVPSINQSKEVGVSSLCRCYNCSSPQHIAVNCPLKPASTSCVKTMTPAKVGLSHAPAVNNVKSAVSHTYVNRVFRNENNSDPNETNCKIVEATDANHDVLASCNKVTVTHTGVNSLEMQNDNVVSHGLMASVDHINECELKTTEAIFEPTVELKLAKFNYMNVNLMESDSEL